MTSIGPYSESNNFTHMFDIPDLRGMPPKDCYCPASIMGIVAASPNTTKFAQIMKLSGLDGVYDEKQANFTLFVPTDTSLSHIKDTFFTSMDSSVAKHIVKTSTLDRIITSDLLESSPASYFVTRDPPNRLFISNIGGETYINNTIRLLHKNVRAINGMFHITDGIIWPYNV